MVRVLGLGDNVCDVYLHTGTMYPGGQAMNFAVYAARMGAQADFMGVFGTDAPAAHNRSALDAEGVGYSHCRSYEGENGYARVTLEQGDRVFKGSNRGGVIQQHPIFLDEQDLAYAKGFDLIHTTNNGFSDSLLPLLHKAAPAVSHDLSFHWNEEDRLERVCPYADFVFLSCSGLSDSETKELCIDIRSRGCAVVTATRGILGATVYDGTDFYHQPPQPVQAIDTLGAGDSFAAAMLVTLLQKNGGPLRDALRDPHACRRLMPGALQAAAVFSAKTCLQNGAFGRGVPVPEELKDRICNGIFYTCK